MNLYSYLEVNICMSFQIPNWDLITKLYRQYLAFNPGDIGGGLKYSSIPKWMAERETAYKKFSTHFLKKNLSNVEHICMSYGRWLSAKNNKSWTNMQRVGVRALDQPEKLCQLLGLIQDESFSIIERVQKGLAGKYKVDGIDKGILTGLFHTLYPEKYGVWNGSTERTFRKLDIYVPGIFSAKRGLAYVRINEILQKLAAELEASLTYVDGFMWYVATQLSNSLK